MIKVIEIIKIGEEAHLVREADKGTWYFVSGTGVPHPGWPEGFAVFKLGQLDAFNGEEMEFAHGGTTWNVGLGECEHIIVPSRFGWAECSKCGARFEGWYCPSSKSHLCDYEQEDGTYDEDQCRYCGQPLERK